jgi:hypothetical protein
VLSGAFDLSVCAAEGCLLSGLLVLEVKVSLVVMFTLSVRLSSTPLVVR